MIDRKIILYGFIIAVVVALFFWFVIPALATHDVDYGEWSECIPNEGNECGEAGGIKYREVTTYTYQCPDGYSVNPTHIGKPCYKTINHFPYLLTSEKVKVAHTEIESEACEIPEEEVVACEEPTPSDSPKGDDRGDYHGSDPLTIKVCEDTKPGNVASVNSVRVDDDTVEVQWSLPVNADKVHILYREDGRNYEHALLNTPNDGNEEINVLKDNVKYFFSVAGVNGCAVGQWSTETSATP